MGGGVINQEFRLKQNDDQDAQDDQDHHGHCDQADHDDKGEQDDQHFKKITRTQRGDHQETGCARRPGRNHQHHRETNRRRQDTPAPAEPPPTTVLPVFRSDLAICGHYPKDFHKESGVLELGSPHIPACHRADLAEPACGKSEKQVS